MNERKKAFFTELAALLHKHKVEIETSEREPGDEIDEIDFNFNPLPGDSKFECVEAGSFVGLDEARKLANEE